MEPLIEALRQKQALERISGAAIAARLGVSEAHWSRLRSEDRRVSLDMLHRILLLWPDLEEQVVEYLKNGG